MAADQRRRRRAAAIYRRHHRPAEGRDAEPRQSHRGGVGLRRLGPAGARRAQRDRARDLRAAAVPHLRADGGAALRHPPRQSDLAAPALRRRSRDARHRGQARHAISRRADDVDRDRRTARSRQARSVLAGQRRLRRRAAAGRGRADPRAAGRHEAEERLGHDRNLLARHRASQGRPGQARLDRADAARHRDGRGVARRSRRS